MPSWTEASQPDLATTPVICGGRRRGLRPDTETHLPAWALEPKLLPVGDGMLRVFGIRTTAFVLGISVVSQRRWEGLGLLPAPVLRLEYPTAEFTRRIYSEAMVETLAVAVERHEVGPRRPPSSPFFREVATAWESTRVALGLPRLLRIRPATT